MVSGLHADGISHVGRRVDGNRARGHLTDGHDIGENGIGHPGMADNHLVLDQGQHGVSAAEPEESDLEV